MKDGRWLFVHGRAIEDFQSRGRVPVESALPDGELQRFQIIEAAEAETGNRRDGISRMSFCRRR